MPLFCHSSKTANPYVIVENKLLVYLFTFALIQREFFSQQDDAREDASEEMLGSASTLIREWAEHTLGAKFSTLSALSRYLVDNHYVDNKSLAAICILCPHSENKGKFHLRTLRTGHKKYYLRPGIKDQILILNFRKVDIL